MAEIDTTAPFASVRDAIYMFGEHSAEKTQHVFLTTHDLQLQKIHSLEVELHQLREEHVDIENQLLISETIATNTIKELAEIKNELKENKQKEENNISSKIKELAEIKNELKENKQKEENNISSKIKLLESQLNAMCEQENQRLQEIECSREEIKNLHDKLKYLDFQHQTTLDTLNKAQEENNKLQDETNEIMCKHEHYLKEQENIASERMKDLIKDLFATKEMLTKANAARANIEEELNNSKIKDLERAKDKAYYSNIEIEKLKNKLQDAEDKQEEIILVVEKLKNELIVAKEAKRKALQDEMDANLILKRMKVEVEVSKVAKENVKMLVIHLEDMNSKLKDAKQEEQNLLASLASLKAELKNSNNELHDIKNEAKEMAIEMEEQLNQVQVDLNAAIMREAKTKECLSNMNEALQQVTAEVVEAKAATTQAIEEVVIKTQDLQEALLHNKTLESRLEAAMKEIQAAKASEVFANTEVNFFKKKVTNSVDANENRQEVTISYDEYETMTKRITDSEDLAKKRIAAALAQVNASKANELEVSKKLESIKKLLERSQMAMKQVVQVAENAEAAKFAVEGELRKWRSENEQRRKAAVAAVMAVGNNRVVKICTNGNNSYNEKTTPTNESNGNGSPNTLKSKQTLAQVLRYNFVGDEKTKKKLFSRKISSYFNKKIK